MAHNTIISHITVMSSVLHNAITLEKMVVGRKVLWCIRKEPTHAMTLLLSILLAKEE